MVGNPVDFANLRTMTDGDAELEKALFEEFFVTFEEGLTQLDFFLRNDSQESWRTTMHAMKGIALNLGAERLGELCKQGQERQVATAEDERLLLEELRAEYLRVKQFLSASL